LRRARDAVRVRVRDLASRRRQRRERARREPEFPRGHLEVARDERARDAAGVPAEDHRVVRGLEVA
jgi:hypothetical protein